MDKEVSADRGQGRNLAKAGTGVGATSREGVNQNDHPEEL